MVSWKRCGSCITMPTDVAQRLQGVVADVVAVDADLACAHVVDAGHEQRARGLARARRPDERDELAGRDGEADVAQDPRALVVGVGGAGRPPPATGSTRPPPTGGGTTRGRTRPGPTGSTRSTAPGRSVIERREVEHLEDPLERHQRGQHVDPRVRELRERLVDLARRRPRRRRWCRRRWCRRSPGCRRRSRRSRCRWRRPGPSAANRTREYIAVCTPMSRTRPARSENVSRLAAVLAEQLHDQRAADVEALGDGVVHRRVELHALAGEPLQLRAHPLRRDDEERQDDEREHGEPPLEREHERERHDDATRRWRTRCRACW